MSSDNAKTVFLNALEIASPEARRAYLGAQYGNDQSMGAEVEELLRHYEQLAQLGESASVAKTTPPPAERPGTQIGPYKLLQQIGEGGMGVVYLAEQAEPIARRVALKIIKPGMDTQQVVARFEAERQALAMMDHVNIARVFDAGTTPAGLPYFVMELVHGVPITQYCDDRRLTPRERLELFVPVCQAIQHAHQKGIIHRDIKPSNVMVTLYDGQPVPKVIDFGVAKATEQKLTERTLFTQYGTLVGTLEYMSPEQAEVSALGVDTRSDIFSLGVLLYELLTGNTPLTHKRMNEGAYAEILRMIKEDEPPRPSTRLSDSGEALASISANRHMEPVKLTKLVRGELDWIVMKTLEKDRNRRYETAKDFAADVQRYLTDEPVLACPPSAWYRLRKFALRNRRALATALLVVAMLVGGIIATTLQALRATQAEQKALADRDAKGRALDAERKARQEATRAGEQTLEALRAMSDAAVSRQIAGQAQLTDQDRAFFTGVIAQYERLATIRGDGAESRALRAEGNYRVGFMRYRLQEWRDALPAFEQARDLYRDLAAHFPAVPSYRRGLAESYQLVGQVLSELGRGPEAETEYRQAIAQYQRLDADFPGSPEYRAGIGSTRGNLAGLLKTQGRLSEAEAEFRLALAAAEQLAASFPAVRGHRHQLVMRHLTLGLFLWERQKNQAEGELELRRALDLQMKLSADLPDDLGYRGYLARCHRHLGSLVAARGQPADAEAEYRAALAIENKLAAEYPAVPGYRKNLAQTHWCLGNLLADQGKAAGAEAEYRPALALQQRLLDDFPGDPAYNVQLALTHHRLGVALERQKLPDQAADAYGRAVALWAKQSADFPDQPNYRENLANCRSQLGHLVAARGQPADAAAEYRAALIIENKLVAEFPAVPSYRMNLARTHWALGNLLAEQAKPADADAEYRMALALQQKLMDDFPGDPGYSNQLALTYKRLGIALGMQGLPDQSIAAHRRAVEQRPNFPSAYLELIDALLKAGHHDEAIAACREAVGTPVFKDAARRGSLSVRLNNAAWRLATHPDSQIRNPTRAVELATEAVGLSPDAHWNTLGAAHCRAGDYKAAVAALEKSMTVRNGGDSLDWFFLAIAHWHLGDKDEASKWYDQAVAWMDKNQPDNEELRRFRAEAAELMGIGGGVEAAPSPREKS